MDLDYPPLPLLLPPRQPLSTQALAPRSVANILVGAASLIGSLLIIAIGFWLVYRRVDWHDMQGIWSRVDVRLFALAVGVFWLQYFLLAARFHAVIRWLTPNGLGAALPFSLVFRIVCASGFVSAVAPIGLFGDVARFAGLKMTGGISTTAAARATVFDRIIGLQWICVAGLLALPWQAESGVDRRVMIGEGAVFFSVCLGIFFLNGLSKRMVMSPWPLLVRLGLTFVDYKALLLPRRSLLQFGLVLASIVSAGISLILVSVSLGFPAETRLFFQFLPLVLVVNSVPFLYMGWGGREFVFASTIGSAAGLKLTESLSISAVWGLVLVASAALNGLVLLFRRTEDRRRTTAL